MKLGKGEAPRKFGKHPVEKWALNYAIHESRVTGDRHDIARVWLDGFIFACKKVTEATGKPAPIGVPTESEPKGEINGRRR